MSGLMDICRICKEAEAVFPFGLCDQCLEGNEI